MVSISNPVLSKVTRGLYLVLCPYPKGGLKIFAAALGDAHEVIGLGRQKNKIRQTIEAIDSFFDNDSKTHPLIIVIMV